AYDIMLQIAQGAKEINSKIVHRDIKPDNILVSSDTFKISDFGLSKLVAEQTRTRTFKGMGPIQYIAPEAWQLQKNTPQMDVYSVGLVFHEILTLKHPLLELVSDPSHVEAWREAHLFTTVPDVRETRPDVTLQLAQLLGRMISKRAS
ncbi:unnamed protein product, partial [marine sediment metagenome]